MIVIEPFHFVGATVSLLLFYQSLRLVKTRKENLFEFLVWVTFGVGILLYTVASALEGVELLGHINGLVTALGFGNEWRGLFAISIVALYLVVFYTYTLVKTTDRRLADLQQEIALLRYELEESRSETPESGPPAGPDGSRGTAANDGRQEPTDGKRGIDSAGLDGAPDGGRTASDGS